MRAHNPTGIEDLIDRANTRLVQRTQRGPAALEVYEDHRYRWLQNDDGTLHSLMDRRSPERLVLPYTAAMMAALLFIDAPRSVSMLGLGAGSQARFLRHYFSDVSITAWESNAEIIDIARHHFGLSSEDSCLRIINQDARIGVADEAPPADLILLDLFAAGGLPAWVRGESLHCSCRRRLGRHAVLVCNFWVDAEDELLGVMNGVQEAFEARTLVLTVPGYHNLIVLAFDETPCLAFAELRVRAASLSERTGLDYAGMLAAMCETNASDEIGFVLA